MPANFNPTNPTGKSLVRLLLSIAVVVVSALSVEAQERASNPEPGKAITTPLVTQSAPSVTGSAGAATTPAPKEVATKEPDKPIPHIALLVPLGSKTFNRVADALKQGFVAGAEADGKNAMPYRIYTTEDEGASLAAQYRKAVNEGALTIIGGVTRDGASTMARESRFLPTLALNAPAAANDNDLPDRFFYISLSLDLEAKLIARMASSEGLKSVAMVVARNPLAQRIQEAFEKEWRQLGGDIVATISFGNEANDATRVASAMEKVGSKANAVVLAAEPAAARPVRPYLPAGMPVFATSHTVDPRAQAIANLDIDTVRYLEMPWFAEPDHVAVMAYAKPAQAVAVDYERLYALGIDAWRLSQLIAKTDDVRKLAPLDGVTGRITLEGHQFLRAPSSVEVRDGRTQPYRRGE
ncbi:MAG: penicillin-binding protein activator [Usitatibacteraceae bacterium]